MTKKKLYFWHVQTKPCIILDTGGGVFVLLGIGILEKMCTIWVRVLIFWTQQGAEF